MTYFWHVSVDCSNYCSYWNIKKKSVNYHLFVLFWCRFLSCVSFEFLWFQFRVTLDNYSEGDRGGAGGEYWGCAPFNTKDMKINVKHPEETKEERKYYITFVCFLLFWNWIKMEFFLNFLSQPSSFSINFRMYFMWQYRLLNAQAYAVWIITHYYFVANGCVYVWLCEYHLRILNQS